MNTQKNTWGITIVLGRGKARRFLNLSQMFFVVVRQKTVGDKVIYIVGNTKYKVFCTNIREGVEIFLRNYAPYLIPRDYRVVDVLLW